MPSDIYWLNSQYQADCIKKLEQQVSQMKMESVAHDKFLDGLQNDLQRRIEMIESELSNHRNWIKQFEESRLAEHKERLIQRRWLIGIGITFLLGVSSILVTIFTKL